MAEKVVRVTRGENNWTIKDDGCERVYDRNQLFAIFGFDLPQRAGETAEFRIKRTALEFPLPPPDDGVSHRWEFDRRSHPGKDCRRADFLFRKGDLDAWYCMDDQGMQYFVWIGKCGFDSSQGIWSLTSSREFAKAVELGILQPTERFVGPKGGTFIGWVGITGDSAHFDCWIAGDRLYLRSKYGDLQEKKAREFVAAELWQDAYILARDKGLAGPRYGRQEFCKLFLGRFGDVDGWYCEHHGKKVIATSDSRGKCEIRSPYNCYGVMEEICQEAEQAGVLDYAGIKDAQAKLKELNDELAELGKVG